MRSVFKGTLARFLWNAQPKGNLPSFQNFNTAQELEDHENSSPNTLPAPTIIGSMLKLKEETFVFFNFLVSESKYIVSLLLSPSVLLVLNG